MIRQFLQWKWVAPLLAAFVLAACGGGGGGGVAPAAPATPTQLAAVVFSGDQEVPAIVTTGSGSATVAVSADGSQIDFTVDFTGLTSPTTLAHIHIGPPGVSGPPIVNLALAAFTSPLTGSATAADFVAAPAQNINTFAEAVAAILAGNTYINVHTTTNPTGEIRGALGPATLTATLTGGQEVPAVTPAGTGNGTFIFDNLQTQIDFDVTFAGLTSATTLAHIHVGPPGVAGPPIVDLDLVGGFISPLTGVATAANLAIVPAQGINTFNDAINAILSGNSYVNVHTVNNPTGEIRGQLAGVLATPAPGPAANVVFVNNSVVSGNGSQTSPFATLAEAQLASLPGEIIFVFAGDGTDTGMNAGITLKAGQKLIGEGVGLASPLIAAGAAPVISNVSILGGNIPVVVLAGGNEVAGIQVSGAGAGNSVGIQGVGVAGFNIHDNVLDGLEREGILLSNASGTGVIANNTFSNLTGANAGNAIDYITTAAGVSLGINDNDFNNIAETCMRVRFDAGGGTVSVTGNTLTTAVASNAGSRGIDVDASLTSVVSSTISNNIVGSAASTQINRSGIQVNASNGGTHRSAVSGNTVENAGADGSAGIEVQAADLVASSVCLQLTGNTSSTGLGYSLDNRDGGTLQAEGADLAALQAANTGTFDVPAPGIVTFVAPGTCGL